MEASQFSGLMILATECSRVLWIEALPTLHAALVADDLTDPATAL
jgi:hypothetical protein